MDTLDKKKKKTLIQKWTKSISNYTASEMTESYRFPCGAILSAKEIEIKVQDQVGVRALQTSFVPGPHKKPTLRDKRIETLQYLDEHPEEVMIQQDSKSSELCDAIIAGATKKAFLKALEGNDKNATRLGHQNEPKYIKQFYLDSQEGLVPDVTLVDLMACGLAMKIDKPYVRCSADAIAVEEKQWEALYFDGSDDEELKSHPAECKCRSQGGYNGSLAKAKSIASTIAGLQGLEGGARNSMENAVYHRISSNKRELMAMIIPHMSEQVQILHHAYIRHQPNNFPG